MSWQPIETAPKDGTPVLVCLECEFGGSLLHVGKWSTTMNGRPLGMIGGHMAFDLPPATHWMPLPAPPQIGVPLGPLNPPRANEVKTVDAIDQKSGENGLKIQE
jgi:hypothetical protein